MSKNLQTGFLILFSVLLFLSNTYAQERQIVGKVIDEKSTGLPGAKILLKGTNKRTISDADGNFVIDAPPSGILTIGSVGYTSKEIQITGSTFRVEVSLEPEKVIQEEVSTIALGIQRDKNALTYATQQITGDELRRAANTNFVDALNGKATGIDIKISSSGVGGSTKAIIRGNRSLQGSSEPLYVIDGIPMVNNKGDQPGSWGGTDGGDGLSMISTADIESISILRGANAATLYGSQGANGVFLITTKKGKAGKLSVDFNSSTVMEKVSGLPDFQFRYGTVGEDYSWTPVGTAVVKSDNYQKDYIKDFFQTGLTASNSATVSGGNAKSNVYFSYANVSAKGIMPTNTYHKNNFSFRQATKLLKAKLTVSSGVILSSEVSKNRPGAGYRNNPLIGLYLFARDRNFNGYKNDYAVFDKARNLNKMNWYSTDEKQNNPYWEIYKNTKLQISKRVIANAKISYDILENLKFEVRGNIDYNNVLDDKHYAAAGNAVSVSPNGSWNYSRYTDQSIYTDGILTYNNRFGKLSLNALAGLSYQKNKYYDGITVNNGSVSLQYPNVFTFANIPYNIMFTSDPRNSENAKRGAFANLAFGFKDFLFLDLTGRNDWYSTSDIVGNQSNFNPSIGGSMIISQMVRLPETISLLKVRASLSQTVIALPYDTQGSLVIIGGAGSPSGPAGLNIITRGSLNKLKPENLVTNEYGVEAHFFKDIVKLDFTIYNSASSNQLFALPGDAGSGAALMYYNAGKITNKGFELSLDAEAIRKDHITWNTSLNLSQNRNKIVELIASNPDFQVGSDSEGFAAFSKTGGSINDLYISHFARNDEGQIILSANGVPTRENLPRKVGNVNPKLLLGWNNNISYRNFFASVLVNGKFGGVALSKTEAFLDSYGVSERTAAARDEEKVAINAVTQEGKTVTSIDPYTYYSAIGDRNKIMEPYVFSRTNVRLGQFVLGYSFKPNSVNPMFREASISLVGRNLFFFYKKAPFDPEQAMSTNNAMQSADVFGMPSTRSYGLNLKFSF